jgi:NAD(P)-dependent dehydrogenase (short-subunit alcohol dehydrogenase family)
MRVNAINESVIGGRGANGRWTGRAPSGRAGRTEGGEGGVILQTASTNGLVGQPFYADYNATKAGVIELTKTMALELAPKIRVCAVSPGYVLTPMQRAEYTDASVYLHLSSEGRCIQFRFPIPCFLPQTRQ